MASSDAPISIGSVSLVVNDLERVMKFYTQVLGLGVISQAGNKATLGVEGRPLIMLHQDALARRFPTEAGLFHTAFLLPKRADLGAWLRHTSDIGVSLDGASDHLVSEALYLHDPEGNGIEVYWDRPRLEWAQSGDAIKMDTLPLDLTDLANASDDDWVNAPTDTVIGHVHLQVGDVAQADAFMKDVLGMTKTFGLSSAGWYGSGGYHHHLAANVWNSKGAHRRSEHSTGVTAINLLVAPSVPLSGEIIDPWGTRFTTAEAQTRAA